MCIKVELKNYEHKTQNSNDYCQERVTKTRNVYYGEVYLVYLQ